MNRKASANWKGNLKEGKGRISTESRVLQDTQYSFKTRFEQGKGTVPESKRLAPDIARISWQSANIMGSITSCTTREGLFQ